MRIAVLSVVSLLCGLTAGAAEAAVAPKPKRDGTTKKAGVGSKIEGIYFLRGGPGEGRVLQLDGKRFRYFLHVSSGRPLEIHGNIWTSGRTVFFVFFNGKSLVRFSCTYAVVDGELWLGVFRKAARKDGTEVWNMIPARPEFFGRRKGSVPEVVGIAWIGDKWKVRLSSSKPPITVEGIREIRPAKRKGPDGPFIPVFPDDKKTVQLAGAWASTQLAAGAWAPTGFGCGVSDSSDVYPGKLWRFGITAARGKGPVPKEKLARIFSSTKSSHRSNTGKPYYERRGDVIMTPWSINLGPVGLVPVKLKPEEASGVWVNEANAKDRVTIRGPKKEGAQGSPLHFPWMFGTTSPKRVKSYLSKAVYAPDSRGIAHHIWGWNCCMGHGDYPFHTFWAAVSRDRMVRHITRGGCMASTYPEGKIDFFRRASRAPAGGKTNSD